ncbi:hypothetical protein [Chryseobacterium sp.]|uniref:hypothetical protein n=1 Tax=Chryseobacterium sp. TaxID=1871047 RepID=UPI00289C35FF|nr:hypothetical protein [Chryseobacterium sp.]
MKKKILILAGIAIIVILYFYYGGNYMENKGKEYYNQFNKSSINSTILDLNEYARGVKLHLDNGEVIFYPITSELNENNIFIATAKKGDKVVKKPFQDTITLVRQNGVMLKYTFQKPK